MEFATTLVTLLSMAHDMVGEYDALVHNDQTIEWFAQIPRAGMRHQRTIESLNWEGLRDVIWLNLLLRQGLTSMFS